MGGKSRKSRGVSEKLIRKLAREANRESKKTEPTCGTKKEKAPEGGLGLDENSE